MAQLTKTQQDLIDNLVKEFTKINPTKDDNTKRFSIDTINNCLNEREQFFKTIATHNRAMIDTLEKQIRKEIKQISKEFDKAFTIEDGQPFRNGERYYTIQNLVEYNKKSDHILNPTETTESNVFLVSKSKDNRSPDYNYFGKIYKTLFLRFKKEEVSILLESGEKVRAHKVVGLEYSDKTWTCRDRDNYPTLDSIIQSNKSVQQAIVNLVK